MHFKGYGELENFLMYKKYKVRLTKSFNNLEIPIGC